MLAGFLRLTLAVRVHTYLTVEAYGAVHYGNQGGEFRLGAESVRLELTPGTFVDLPKIPTPLWDAGLGLRVSL